MTSYVLPTIWTVRHGFVDVDINSRERRDVGTDNYELLSGAGMYDSFGYALSLALVPLLILLVLAPALAYAAHRTGRGGRLAARVLLSAPLVCVAWTAIAAGHRLALLTEGSDAAETWTKVETAPGALRETVAIASFGLVCAVGVLVYLAALRRQEQTDEARRRRVWPGLLVGAGLSVLGAVAVALQTFTFPYVVTGGGPARATYTPLLDVYEQAFWRFDLGPAAALSSVLLGVLAVLGVLATLLIVVTNLRIELDPRSPASEPEGWSAGRVGAALACVLGLLGVLAVSGFGLWPWLTRLAGSPEDLPGPDPSGIAAQTWLPPAVSAAVAVFAAALAGFGIGGLRPLGRFSELLLLPFAPWLFVGTGPLLVARLWDAMEGERLNTFVGLIPPVWVSVPALFLFTVFFKGQERRRRALVASGAGGGAWSTFVPVLVLVPLAFGAVWVSGAYDLLWPLVVAAAPEQATTPVLLLSRMEAYGARPDLAVGGGLAVGALLICFLVVVVAQVLHLDRLGLRVGRR